MKKKAVLEFDKAEASRVHPDFKAGDTLSVKYRIWEGGKERIQLFKGLCISRRGSGMSETFMVRKVTMGFGVERVFPLQSPHIAEIKLDRHGKVSRAKLYYLRDLTGKATRIAEEFQDTKEGAAAAKAEAASSAAPA